MIRSNLSTKTILLATGIGLSTAVFVGSQPAAAQSYSDEYTCPAGTVYDPTYGCTLSGDAYEPYDYGYYGDLPYGAYGLHHGRDFGHGFAHGIGGGFNHGAGVTVLRGSPPQGLAHLGGDSFEHGTSGDLGDHGVGFAHTGFGHGVAGGFGHSIGRTVDVGRGFNAAHFGGGGFAHGMGVAHFGGFGAHAMGGGFHGGGGFGGGGHR